MKKIAQWIFCLVILTGVLVLPTSAVIPDTMNWDPYNTQWMVANGKDVATLKIFVTNNSGNSTAGLPVEFNMIEPGFGTLSASTITVQNGVASTVFKTGTKSGSVNISAKILYKVNESDPAEPYVSKEALTQLNIDHDSPYTLSSYLVPPKITVGSYGAIQLAYKDQWGNPVDNRNSSEEISFEISSADGTAKVGSEGFYGTSFVKSVDSDGNFKINMLASESPGTNIILANPVSPLMGDLPDKYFYIQAIANGTPMSIEQSFDPDGYLGQPPKQYADGESLYQIVYTIKDQYGNGILNTPINIRTTISGEEITVSTNPWGQAMLTYGPKSSFGKITIYAVSQINSSVKISKEVMFISQEAVDIQFSAVPESIPSRDVEGWAPAQLRAKVIDENGNPVEGETVTFTMGTPIYTGMALYNATLAPELVSNSAISDLDGYATVLFNPGAFSRNWSDSKYNPTSTGQVVVTAHWENVSRGLSATPSLTMKWKNYPYLSLLTSVYPQTVNVTDTVDVMIQLKGDGWALEPNPIDVVLVVDRSGSMAGSKISSAKTAGKIFVSQMSRVRDRIGVVSYAGSTSGTQTRVDLPLSQNYTSVNTSLDSLAASGATETREALKQSIELIRGNSNPNPKTVKAIILLTDGDWNYKGTPLAKGTGWPANASHTWSTNSIDTTNYLWYDGLGGTLQLHDGHLPWRSTDGQNTNQNMTNYAKNSSIRLYMISFGSGLGTDAVNAMKLMANSTGGFYQNAPDGTALSAIYTRIAGELRTEAGVNTQVDLDFGKIEVNTQTVTVNDTYKVLEYVPDGITSTRIHSYDAYDETSEYIPAYVRDDTDYWNQHNRSIYFNVGTVKLGQIWEATYKLRVMSDGSINIFGPDSTIIFDQGVSTLLFPKTYITGVAGIVTTGINSSELNVTSGESSSGSDESGVPYIEWPIYRHYTGKMNVTERYYISNDGGKQWILVGEKVMTPAEADKDGIIRYPKILLPPGFIDFKVESWALDAPGPIIGPAPQRPPEVIPAVTGYIHLT